MSDIDSVIAQLERQRAAIDRALSALREISSGKGSAVSTPAEGKPVNKGRLTPAGRKRIAEATKRRWAEKRAAEAAGKDSQKAVKTARGHITPAGRKRLADAMRRRWAAKRASQAAPRSRAKVGLAKKAPG